MSFTRFHDDTNRIEKQLQQSTGLSRYQLDAPGPGLSTPFIEDPHLRLQKWGANMQTNSTNLESDLRGMTRQLTRDVVDYKTNTPSTVAGGMYSNDTTSIVDETRASNPAWRIRDLEHTRWTEHQISTVSREIPFTTNESTRIAQKENFARITK
jgi:hypothetical protein